MDAFFKKILKQVADVEMAEDNLMQTAQAKPKYVPWIEK